MTLLHMSDRPEGPDDWVESEKACPECGLGLWTAGWWDDPPEAGGACIGRKEKCGSCGHFETH